MSLKIIKLILTVHNISFIESDNADNDPSMNSCNVILNNLAFPNFGDTNIWKREVIHDLMERSWTSKANEVPKLVKWSSLERVSFSF